jgi:hypothetical protein
MQSKGTLCKKMHRKKYNESPVRWNTGGFRKYKEKTQQGVANVEVMVSYY